MAISVRFEESEEKLIKEFSEMKGTTVSELVRTAVIEKIEDEIDLELYNKAMEEHLEKDESITHKEMKKELGL